MTKNGKIVISALLRKNNASNVTRTDGTTGIFYGAGGNNIFAIKERYNQATHGGTSIILSTESNIDENAYIPTGIIELLPSGASTSISNDGTLILTYVFTNTLSNAITINSVGLATKTILETSYPDDSSTLIAWNAVPTRIVQPTETFTYSVAITQI